MVPVVVDYGGPGELVSPASGFLIPMGDRAAIVAGLRAVLHGIVDDPAALAPRSAQAVLRARSLFAWSAKARQTLEVYRWVLGRRPDKPAPRLPFADPVAGPGLLPAADAVS